MCRHCALPLTTQALAPLCVSSFHGLSIPSAVPVSPLPRAQPCTPTPPIILLPLPPVTGTLSPPSTADADPLTPTTLSLLCDNSGGITAQVALARAWVEALNPDLVTWQQLWDLPAGLSSVPDHYEHHLSTATGPGTGFLPAWRRAALLNSPPVLAYDGEHWIAFLVHLDTIGRVMVVNTHLHPHLSFSAWVAEAKHITHLHSQLRPDLSVVMGDFNNKGTAGTPHIAVLGTHGCVSCGHRLLPPGTTTNFTTVLGSARATSIDHVFLSCPVASLQHHHLPSRNTRTAHHDTATLHTQPCDAPS